MDTTKQFTPEELFKLFQQAGQIQKNYLLKNSSVLFIKEKMDTTTRFTPEELEEFTSKVIAWDRIPEEEKLRHSDLFYNSPQADLVYDITKTIVGYGYHLKTAVDSENFELCCKIRDCIEIERKEFIYCMERFHPQFDPSIVSVLENIVAEVRKVFQV